MEENVQLLSSESSAPPPPVEPAIAILERRRRALLCAAFAGALAGAGVAMLLPAVYEASAHLVIVPVDDPTVSGGTNALDASNATLPMLTAVLRSRGVAEETVTRLGLAQAWRTDAERARKRLTASLEIAPDRKTNLVTISVEAGRPSEARQIAATVAELAALRSGELWAARDRDHRLRIEAQLADSRARLEADEDALREFRERSGVVDLPTQVAATVAQAAELERRRIEKGLDVRYARGFGDGGSVEVRRGMRERDAAAGELATLRQNAARPLLPLDALPRLEQEHARLKRAIDAETARHDLLALKVSQLSAAEARPNGRAELVDPPAEPTQRSGPSRVKLAAAGATLASLACAAALVMLARRRRPLVLELEVD
jgi:uncharacterized protein involved in exopolysaccharide biosynthesis